MLLWEMTWRPFCTEIAFVGKSSKKYGQTVSLIAENQQ